MDQATEFALSGFQISMIIGIVLLLFICIIAAIGYVKAPPDTAYIISGLRKEARFIVGRAGIKIPFLERKDELSLRLIKIDVKTSESIPTADYINITVDSNVNIKVGNSIEDMQKAAKNFLNQDDNYIRGIVKEVLEGNVREIVGKMKLTDMIGDRKAFSDLVADNVKPDLKGMGLELISFNVQNFEDAEDVIQNLGIDNIVAIRKSAAISKANAERDIQVAKAQADKEANDARVAADTAIAERKNELLIKQASLKKQSDTEKAIADKAYDIETAKQQREVNIVIAEAETAKQEKLIAVREKEVEVTEKELHAKIIKPAEAAKEATIIKAQGEREAKIIDAEASKQSKTIEAEADLITTQKDADGKKYQAEKSAEANLFQETKVAEAELIKKQKVADAERYNKEQEAEATKAIAAADLVKSQKDSEAKQYDQERQAEGIKALAAANLEAAQAEAKGIEAKGQAEGISKKAIGEGEASAIEAKGLAEAEAKNKLADAMQKYGEAAMKDMAFDAMKEYIKVLPDIAGNVAKPLAGVKEMKLYGDGNIAKMTGDITKSMTQIVDGIKDATGMDVAQMLNSFVGSRAALAVADKEDKK